MDKNANLKSSDAGGTVNREYKDRLFKMIFGSEEHKDWALSLYNAVNGTQYTNTDDLRITTIDDFLYMDMHNDVSYLFNGDLSLYKHQSSVNPNMPLRGLSYFAGLYERYVKENRKNQYGKRLIRLPVPRFVVFYNGTDNAPDEQVLRLSDAFEPERREEACVEVKAVMLNINSGHNTDLMEKCRQLGEYAAFVAAVRSNENSMEAADAVYTAIRSLPADSSLRLFLEMHEVEVTEVYLTEFDRKEYEEILREEVREECRLDAIRSVMKSLKITAEKAMEVLHIPKESWGEYMSML